AVKHDSEKKYVDLNQPREDDQYIVTKTWEQNVALQQALTPFPTTRTNQEVISSGDETLANNLPRLVYVGQTDTYLLAQHNRDLFLIDQVAARRRLKFEQIFHMRSEERRVGNECGCR